MRNCSVVTITIRTIAMLMLFAFVESRPRLKIDKKHTPSGQLIINTAKQALAALHQPKLVSRGRQKRSAMSLSSLLPDEPEGTRVVGFDVLLTPTQWRIDNLFNSQGHRQKRKAVRFQRFHWPNGIIPYKIHKSVDAISHRAKSVIASAMQHWEAHTCLRFERYDARKHGRDYVEFRRGSWCASKLGRVNGRQPLYLAWGCLKRGTIVHEIGHTVGWIHEQARPDRDDHVTIRWDMIASGYKDQYLKHHKVFINTYDVPYDYNSIMHYPSSGEILTKDKAYQYKIGQREKLSFYDVKLANIMYKCAERAKCSSKIKCKAPGYVGPKCQCVCPDGTRSCDINEGSLNTNHIFGPGDDNTVHVRRTTRRRTTTSTTTMATTSTRRPTTSRPTTTLAPPTTTRQATTTTLKPTTQMPTTTTRQTTTEKQTTTMEPTTQSPTTEGGNHVVVKTTSYRPTLSISDGGTVEDTFPSSDADIVTTLSSSESSSSAPGSPVTSTEPSIDTSVSSFSDPSQTTSSRVETTLSTKNQSVTSTSTHPPPSSTTTVTIVTTTTPPSTTLSVYWRRKWQPVWRKRWSNKRRNNKTQKRKFYRKAQRTTTTSPTTQDLPQPTSPTPNPDTTPFIVGTDVNSRDEGCWVKIPGFFILGHNDDSMGGASLEQCQQRCVTTKRFKCKSFDYWADKKRCYLSSKTRISVDSRRFTMDQRMVHYQRKPCHKTICPYGWNSVDGRCVKVFTSATSFKRAEYNCKQRKAGIMTVTQESGRMLRQMTNQGLLPYREFWVVAPKLTRDFWSTIYSFCSHVNIGKGQITLDENFCYKKNAYICEREPLS